MKHKRLLCILGIGVVMIAAALWFTTTDACGIAKVRHFSRLAPFPSGMRELKVVKDKRNFTWDYRISFMADPTEIRRWIHDSPGLASLGEKSVDGKDQIYEIRPDDPEDWHVTEVRIDSSFTKVQIRTFWN